MAPPGGSCAASGAGARSGFEFRVQSQPVFVDRPSGDVVLRLHKTDIVRVSPRGDVTLCTGGWATPKTMSSMNDALELFDMYVDCETGRAPQGRWRVFDSDNSVHLFSYATSPEPFTIRAKPGSDDWMRAKWLADGYSVEYVPQQQQPLAVAGAGARHSSGSGGGRRDGSSGGGGGAARVLHAPPLLHAGREQQQQQQQLPPHHGGGPAPVAVPPAPHLQQPGGSWANVAASNRHPNGTARTTGPRAASGRVTTGPGANAAAAAAAAAHGPPGFSGGTAAPAGPAQHPAAAGPPLPVTQQLEAHVQQLGIDDDDEDDARLCVVCMEQPRRSVLVPCGHMALCKGCCDSIMASSKACPMCCHARPSIFAWRSATRRLDDGDGDGGEERRVAWSMQQHARMQRRRG